MNLLLVVYFLCFFLGLDCDFDDSTFCGWENDNTGRAKFNWRINSGSTRSWRTGPQADVSGSLKPA